MSLRSTLWAIFLAAFLITSCKKDSQVLPPVILATLSPGSGNTTQKFNFDLSRSESRTGRGTKVFTRWDWDGDGKWDTPVTRLLVYDHRYYVPGTWKPRLEMSNLDGALDTLSFTIPVARGYSPPKPVFIVTPAKGHIFTQFLLDASRTRDDEDSLDQLTFRWDFEGDGQWDTSFGDSVTLFHRYPEVGFFEPKIQVRDPSGLISVGSSEILVNIEDTSLQVSFRCIPDSVTNDTPIIMDASASYDPDFPDEPLLYRWDWENDLFWDTGWLTSPQTEHIFPEEYIHFVRLQVKSSRGLQNQISQKIRGYHKNRPPVASFSVSTLTGNTRTEFRFDCWSTRDFESAPSGMFYRWDFDGDGNWDTDFVNSVITMHQYGTPGIYKTSVQVQDPHGGQDTVSKMIHVSNGTNQTGIYNDTRGLSYVYYGTVLIGHQWWFSRSLLLQDRDRSQRIYNEQYYDEDDSIRFRDYGNLYMRGVLPILCPAGWRVPSREDWDKLFANYPEDELYEALMPGGESDFGATLGGRGTIPGWDGIDRYGYYWSTTKPLGQNTASLWIISFDKNHRKVLRGYDRDDRLYSVRCMKDAD